ncbi:MAG: hypothetical protein WCJ13_01585 [Coriobacteriia bacterium]
MSQNKSGTELQGLFGALLGGMMSSFVGLAVATALQNSSGVISNYGPLIGGLAGLACAIAFMAGGLCVMDRMPWLGSSLLFASGFTTMWSVATSFSAEQRWAVLVVLGGAIAAGAFMGWQYFERGPRAIDSRRDEAVWTH